MISDCALVFRHAPLPTSPVDGGGVTAPSPPAGRVGVGAMFKSHCKDAYKLPCMPEAALAPRGRGQLGDRFPLDTGDGRDHQLRDSVAAPNRERLLP